MLRAKKKKKKNEKQYVAVSLDFVAHCHKLVRMGNTAYQWTNLSFFIDHFFQHSFSHSGVNRLCLCFSFLV